MKRAAGAYASLNSSTMNFSPFSYMNKIQLLDLMIREHSSNTARCKNKTRRTNANTSVSIHVISVSREV